jgi:hypothetical protein
LGYALRANCELTGGCPFGPLREADVAKPQ